MRETFGRVTRRVFGERDPGRPLIAITLAFLTLLASGVAALQADASIRSTVANREADRIAIESTGTDATATLRSGTEYGIFRRWFEQGQRVRWAQDLIDLDPGGSERPLLDELLRIDTELEAWTQQQGVLTQPPYYDPVTFGTDTAGFDADLRVRTAVEAVERRDVEAAVGSEWGAKATGYVTNLTITAVALFFLGLAATLSGGARPFLAGAGSLFGLVALAWTGALAISRVERVPGAAIDKVVESRVQQSYVYFATFTDVLTDQERARYEAAIAAADAAVTAAPRYLSAYLARGETRGAFGVKLLFSTDATDEAQGLLRAAIDDFRHYLAGRPQSYSAWGDLGAYAYHAGDDALSISATDEALRLAPDLFVLHLNRALAFVSRGDTAPADAAVEDAIRTAAGSELATNELFFDYSDLVISRIIRQRTDEQEALTGIQRRMREARVALRARQTVDVPADAPAIDGLDLRLVSITQDGDVEEGEVIEPDVTISAGAGNGFRLRVDGAVPVGSVVSARIWRDGLHQTAYVRDVTWGDFAPNAPIDLLTPYGRARFDIEVGRYDLEVYLDGATRQTLSWTVGPVRPVLAIDAPTLLERFAASGMTCGEPATPGEDAPPDSVTEVTCQADAEEGTQVFRLIVTSGGSGEIKSVQAQAIAAPDASIVEPAGRFFEGVIEAVYPERFQAEAIEWLGNQGAEFHSLRIAGTFLGHSGVDESVRILRISPG